MRKRDQLRWVLQVFSLYRDPVVPSEKVRLVPTMAPTCLSVSNHLRRYDWIHALGLINTRVDLRPPLGIHTRKGEKNAAHASSKQRVSNKLFESKEACTTKELNLMF